MAETSAVVAAVFLAVAAVGAVPVAALTGPAGPAQVTATDDSPANGSVNESLAPGERFAGVVGVQQADVEGEIEVRAFGQRVAAAASNRSAAGVVAGEVEELETRLAELDAEVAELRRAHENGTVSEGEYRARLAALHAKQRAVERRLNRTAAVAGGLPEAALEAKGVNVTAIRTLQSRASELTGPEVAEIARSIAGEGAGKGVGGPPAFVENRTGPPGDRGNGGGPPDDAGPGGETGPPEDAGAGNGTGPSEDAAGNGTGSAGDGQAASDGANAGNESSRAGSGGADSAGNGTSSGSGNGSDASDGSRGSDAGDGDATSGGDGDGADGSDEGNNAGNDGDGAGATGDGAGASGDDDGAGGSDDGGSTGR
jgi:hypothetical protein